MSRNVRISPPRAERLEYHVSTNHERVDRYPFGPPEFRKGPVLSIRVDADLVEPDAKRLLELLDEIGLAVRFRGGMADLNAKDKEWFEAAERVLGPSSAHDIAEAVLTERAKR